MGSTESENNKFKKHKKHKSKKHKKHKSKRNELYDDLSPDKNSERRFTKDDNYDSTGFKRGDNHNNVEIFGYTNDNNPFLDPNLSEKFVWRKNKKQIFKSEDERKTELENIQRRIREHERLKEERLQEQDLMQRAKEAENYHGRKSDSFFDIEQALCRSKIRISNGRAKPIDLLIQYVYDEENLSNSNADIINHEPIDFIKGLSRSDLDDLIVDIKNYYRNMEPGKNTQYWEDVLSVTEDEIEKIDNGTGLCGDLGDETQKQLFEEVEESPIDEAEELVEKSKKVLETGDTKHTNLAFFEMFCKKATVIIARRRLHMRHLNNLQANLDRLKMEQGLLGEVIFPSGSEVKLEKKVEEHTTESDGLAIRETYERSYSPVLMTVEELGEEAIDDVIYDGEEDFQKMEYMRKQYLERGSLEMDRDGELMLKVANEGCLDESGDVEQVAIAPQSFLWSDKYRPRRPKFYNRVNTGFDWNKYNQTHYDVDNPPPKVVQGYRFNIFYTDLIDKSKTPTFDLNTCTDDDNYAILTFKAGPPYEDIAFKVVNREWETSERHGYKCQFYQDVLQLYFHFKRYRYRK